jgi:hypothetical protein
MPSKPKANQESQVLELLRTVLPKTVPDPKLAEKIYSACEKAVNAQSRVAAFEKFCRRCELPNLEKNTIAEVKSQFEASFGKGAVSLVPHPQKEALSVEVVLPNETFEGIIKVNGSAEKEADEEQEIKLKFVPFPVSLEGDPELVWLMGRHENLTAEEGSVALAKAQDNFWESKGGQKLLRDRVDRIFPEFISRVPAKMLTELGLKRHYKDPEPIKQINTLKARKRD